MISEIRLFTRVTVAKAKAVVENPDEPADPERGGGFAEWAMLTLHALRIELAKSYRVALYRNYRPSKEKLLWFTHSPLRCSSVHGAFEEEETAKAH